MIRKYAELPFLKSVVISAVLFLVFVSLFKFVIALISGETFSDIITKMGTSDYLISNILGALVYGIVITLFYRYRSKQQQKS